MKKRSKVPEGWDEERVKRVIEHYEGSSQRASRRGRSRRGQKDQTLMEVPSALVPAVRDLIAKRRKMS
jgi:hypothetical protein